MPMLTAIERLEWKLDSERDGDHATEAMRLIRKHFSLGEFAGKHICCHVPITNAYDDGPTPELDPDDESEMVAWFLRDREMQG